MHQKKLRKPKQKIFNKQNQAVNSTVKNKVKYFIIKSFKKYIKKDLNSQSIIRDVAYGTGTYGSVIPNINTVCKKVT